MKLIEDLGTRKIPTCKQAIRFGMFECPKCGVYFEARTQNINSGNTKSCGCAKYPKPDKYRQTTMYSSWDHMKQRCTNPSNTNYHYYGGAGITVYEPWNTFAIFRDWALANGWINGLTIDRKEPSGNYEPSNCRWVDRVTQSQNTRNLQSNNTTGYRGVYLLKTSGKYKAEIMDNGTRHRLGHFNTALEAAKAYDAYVVNNNSEHSVNGVLNVT